MAVSSVETDSFRMSGSTTDLIEQEVPSKVDGDEIFKQAIEEKKIQDNITDTEIKARIDGPRGKLELGELVSGRTFRWMVNKVKEAFYTPTSDEMH